MTDSFSIDTLLEQMVAHNASDLHVTVGSRPALRVRGQLERLEAFPELSADTTRQLLYRIISSEQQKRLEIDRQLDLSYSIPGLARFRVNVYSQRESLAAAFRMIPAELKTPRGAGPADARSTSLPQAPWARPRDRPDRLRQVDHARGARSTRSTGRAPSTSSRSRTRSSSCTVTSAASSTSASSAPTPPASPTPCARALRQDPDVILLGEMRDLETISTALTAAETGHLVFATLHTQDAASTVDRVIDVFPAGQQGQIRTSSPATLEGVVAQTLLPTADGRGRVAAVEILAARRRGAEPHPPGQDRAGLLGHADRHARRACRRWSRPSPSSSSAGSSREEVAVGRSSRPEMLRGLLGRAAGGGGAGRRRSGSRRARSWTGRKNIKLKDLLPKRGTQGCEDSPARPRRSRAKPEARACRFPERPRRSGEAGRESSRARRRRSRSARRSWPEPRASRHKKLVGLKIGASQLSAARVVNNGSAELVQVAQQPLDPGIIVGGELREPEALAEALKKFFNDEQAAEAGRRLGIASNRIGVRTFDIGGITDPKQLENAIRFRAQETLPIPLEEAVLDYQILGETVDEEGARTQRVLLVVAYRDLVDRYVAACRKAGIKLVGIDLEAFALLRALGERPADAGNAAIVVVTVGSERSTLAVSNGESCEFTRVIEWGGHNLNVVHRPRPGHDADRG